MADSTPKSYHTDPTLYLYTSLTAGSSHIITATSRLETILKANRIPFQALDVATDEKARMLWGRRAGKRKLPGLVRMGMLVGDLEEIEEWNEYGELKDKVGVKPMPSTPSAANTPTKAPSSISTTNTPSKLLSSVETPPRHTSSCNTENPMATAMRQAGAEAARKAGDVKVRALAKAKGASSAPTGAPEKSESSSTSPKPSSEALHAATTNGPVTEATKPASETISTAETGDGADDTSKPGAVEESGSRDPDKEAVVPDSRDTIGIKDDAGAATASGDPDAKAVVRGSNDTVEDDSGAVTDSKQLETDDPDAEAVVPGTKNTDQTVGQVQVVPNDKSEPSQDDEGDTETKPSDSRTVELTTKAASAVNDGEDLPGKKTQEQAAAKADEAGTSVAD
ncbi:MAG: hypothetical protein Q9171_004790 [Xanthocarpia ochracea]